jgi:hypothetical protein
MQVAFADHDHSNPPILVATMLGVLLGFAHFGAV